MRKLTVADIMDLRGTSASATSSRRDHLAQEQRRIALGDLVTIVFENTRRCASRSRRWRAPSACCATSRSRTRSRPTTSSSPRRRALGHAVHRDHRRRRAARMAARSYIGIRTRASRFEVGDGPSRSPGVPDRRGTAHPRRHHRHGPLPRVSVRRRPPGRLDRRPRSSRVDHPEYQALVELSRRAASGALAATS